MTAWHPVTRHAWLRGPVAEDRVPVAVETEVAEDVDADDAVAGGDRREFPTEMPQLFNGGVTSELVTSELVDRTGYGVAAAKLDRELGGGAGQGMGRQLGGGV